MAKSYRIADVCREVDVQPYVLRYWEGEFSRLKAAGSGTAANKRYSEQELGLVRRIKELLYDEGYTIAGAKKKLEAELESDGEAGSDTGTARSKKKGEKAGTGKGAAKSAKTSAAKGKKKPEAGGGGGQQSLDTAAADRLEQLTRSLERLRRDAVEALELARRLD